jgi:hypothetical protein
MFVFRTPRDRDVIRTYADKKSDLDDKSIPDYYTYLKKHIIYARQFNPRLSDEAKSMLSEYWANLAENFGSPRILETLFRLAKARSRLKLKQMVDADDAIETMQFYNVILQQHLHAVKIPTNPRGVTYNECMSILRESKFAISFEEVTRSACKGNEQVKRYLDDKLKMQDNIKLRSILALLLNHTSVKQIQQKPVVLQWIDNNNDGSGIGYDNTPLKTETAYHRPGDDEPSNSNSFGRPLYDVYDACDTQRDSIENDLDAKKYDSKLSTSSTAASYTLYASYSNTTNTITDQQEIQKFAFECYYCKGSNFRTNDENDYQRHVIKKHPGKPCYPSKADLKRLGLKAQEKEWETRYDIEEVIKYQNE